MSSKMQMVFPFPGKRLPQNPDKVTFKRSKEFKLRDCVRERATSKHTPCLFEMSLVFTCLKESSFNESHCVEELQNFNKCYNKVVAEHHALVQRKKNPSKIADVKNLLDVEINQLIQKYLPKGK